MCDRRQQNSNGSSNGRGSQYIIRSLIFIKGKETTKRLLQAANGTSSKSKTYSFILTEKISILLKRIFCLSMCACPLLGTEETE